MAPPEARPPFHQQTVADQKTSAAARRLIVKGAEHYVFAPCNGIFEPKFALGDEVKTGQIAGHVHDPIMPWKEPTEVRFNGSGLALCVRTFALVEAGDCLGHLASDVG